MKPDDLELGLKIVELTMEGAMCELDHGPQDVDSHPMVKIDKRDAVKECQVRPAVQMIVQAMGDMRTGVAYDEMRIPVCQECLLALTDPEERKDWVLIYCYGCGQNHWVCRHIARKVYPPAPIYWVPRCQECVFEEAEKNKQ